MWSKLLYVGEDEDDIVKASFVEDVDDKDGVVTFVIFEDAEDHTVKVVLGRGYRSRCSQNSGIA